MGTLKSKFDYLLSPYVKNVLLLENHELKQSNSSFIFFADGYPGLMLKESALGLFLNSSKKLSALFLYGQTLKPITLSALGNYLMIVFYLYPHVVKSIFGVQVHELTDTCLDLSRLPVIYKEGIVDRLLNTRSGQDQIELLIDFILKLISSSKYDLNVEIQIATSKLGHSCLPVLVRDIQNELRMSERTFLSKFEQQVGILQSHSLMFAVSEDLLKSLNREITKILRK